MYSNAMLVFVITPNIFFFFIDLHRIFVLFFGCTEFLLWILLQIDL